MREPPLVSIVLPTHNGARYLRGAVESCLAQTYSNWELIIVDDASTDSTPAIVTELLSRDPRIRSIRHEKNQRLPGALNTGFAAARGEYLTWTSDDNLYRPPAIQRMVEELEAHPEAAYVYADQMMVDEDLRPLSLYRVPDPDMLLEGPNVTGCFLYRRLVHDRVGPYADDLFLSEDYDYCLRVYAQFQMKPLHEDLYQYRQHSTSLSATKRIQALEVSERALLRALPTIKMPSAQRARAYVALMRKALARRAYLAVLRYAIRAVGANPFSAVRLLAGAAWSKLRPDPAPANASAPRRG